MEVILPYWSWWYNHRYNPGHAWCSSSVSLLCIQQQTHTLSLPNDFSCCSQKRTWSYSLHGAQLTGSFSMPVCASLLEVFPENYAIPALVRSMARLTGRLSLLWQWQWKELKKRGKTGFPWLTQLLHSCCCQSAFRGMLLRL
jgi:hypothetical protein